MCRHCVGCCVQGSVYCVGCCVVCRLSSSLISAHISRPDSSWWICLLPHVCRFLSKLNLSLETTRYQDCKGYVGLDLGLWGELFSYRHPTHLLHHCTVIVGGDLTSNPQRRSLVTINIAFISEQNDARDYVCRDMQPSSWKSKCLTLRVSPRACTWPANVQHKLAWRMLDPLNALPCCDHVRLEMLETF